MVSLDAVRLSFLVTFMNKDRRMNYLSALATIAVLLTFGGIPLTGSQQCRTQ